MLAYKIRCWYITENRAIYLTLIEKMKMFYGAQFNFLLKSVKTRLKKEAAKYIIKDKSKIHNNIYP